LDIAKSEWSTPKGSPGNQLGNKSINDTPSRANIKENYDSPGMFALSSDKVAGDSAGGSKVSLVSGTDEVIEI